MGIKDKTIINAKYVLINENEIVTSYDDLEEEILMLLEEDPEMKIRVYPASEKMLSLDANYIIDSFYDNGVIMDDMEVSDESTGKLQKLLDEWCSETQKVTNTMFEIGLNELDVDEIIDSARIKLTT